MTRRPSRSKVGVSAGARRLKTAPKAVLVECRTCLGSGLVRDGETDELRKCLNCGGAGKVVR